MSDESPSIFVIFLLFACNSILTFLAVSFGLLIDSARWLLFDSFGRREKNDYRKVTKLNENLSDDEFSVIIIGTGFSGIGTAIKLNQMGVTNYILIEKNEHFGGTWYLNTYPGCACDVPSNLYSYSFEQNPNWSYFFSRQQEIQKYLEHCARKYRVEEKVRFGINVDEIHWLEDRKIWKLNCSSESGRSIFYGRFVVAATGPLSTPSYPKDINGIHRFQGQMFHTARWNKDFDFKDKRVAIVGTGASAIQVVPAVSGMPIEKLFVFQRTPPWLIPRTDRSVSRFEKYLFTKFPLLQTIIRRTIYWSRELLVLPFVYRWPTRFIYQELVKYSLRKLVKDEKLREKVTPKWELGCKRVLVTSDWYPALQKPNVQLVTDGIDHVDETGIVTKNGDHHQVDVIIWSTGFETQQFCLPTYGIDGRSLADQWEHTMQAYRGMMVPNFPNLFILLGPNARLGHSSVIIMLEAQLKYLVEALLYIDKHGSKSVMIKESVNNQYNQWIQNRLKQTVWFAGGCKSWYQDARGNVTTIWPDFTWKFERMMSRFDAENYVLT